MTTKKLIIVVSSVLGALLLGVLIVGIVLVNTLTSQARQESYEDCMARQGFEADAPPPVGVDSDEYISAALEAAEFCDK